MFYKDDCEKLSNISLSSIPIHCPKLSSFDLEGMCYVTDLGLMPLARNNHLQSLSLAEAPITDCTLDSISKGCGEKVRCHNMLVGQFMMNGLPKRIILWLWRVLLVSCTEETGISMKDLNQSLSQDILHNLSFQGQGRLQKPFSVIAVSETWLSDLSADQVNIPEYAFISNHRTTKSGGGTVFVYKIILIVQTVISLIQMSLNRFCRNFSPPWGKI